MTIAAGRLRASILFLLASTVTTALAETLKLSVPTHAVTLETTRFKFGFSAGERAIPADSNAGLMLDGNPITRSRVITQTPTSAELEVRTAAGLVATTRITLKPNSVIIDVTSAADPVDITFRLPSLAPVYGLGDRGGQAASTNLAGQRFENMGLYGHAPHRTRWISTFAIFPRDRFAGVLFNANSPSVTFDDSRYAMTAPKVKSTRAVYFIGDLPEVYAAYKAAREEAGYPDFSPQFRLFELGWESWDALRWDTNAATVTKTLTSYLERGYPIRWAVTGSGFWDDGHTTTSFGVFHPQKYPSPTDFRDWLHARDIQWLLGVRTNFVIAASPSNDARFAPFVPGPFTAEGTEKGYFAKDKAGQLITIKSRAFPRTDCYMLDGRNPAAVEWYASLCDKWGVDGFKEDTMMIVSRSDLTNPAMYALHQKGVLTMGRCGAFSAPGTLMRMEDMLRLETITQRMPITWLQYAASAAPNVYSDTIGFNGVTGPNTDIPGSLRHAWLCALTAGMAVGAEPWAWPEADQAILKKAIAFHSAITPYLFSAAVDSHRTGYPHTLTPLPLAYPGDPNTYDLASSTHSQYQWLIGDSLLATPLLKKTYATSDTADIYLPSGTWVDFETGQSFTGPLMLRNHPMPVGHIPAFVGNKALLLLRNDKGALYAAVYPNSPKGAAANFTHPDGKSTTTIQNDAASLTAEIKVTDTTGATILTTRDSQTKALRFPIIPGQTYRITNPLLP